MYSEHFDIIDDPFRELPSTEFFYPCTNQVTVCKEVVDAISRRKGMVLLTGAKGVGKSLMMMRIIDNLDANTHAIRLQDEKDINNIFNVLYRFYKRRRLTDFRLPASNGQVDETANVKNISHFNDNLRRIEVNELVHFVKHNLDEIQIDRVRQLQVLRKSLETGSRHGRNAVVFIDNVKRIDAKTLRELIKLSTAEYSDEKLLQMVIAASDKQTLELVPKFRNSIALVRRIKPLDAVEVEPYLCHLLRLSGFDGNIPFTPNAMQRIALHTKRIPRRINGLCRRSIAIAERGVRHAITPDIIERAAFLGKAAQVKHDGDSAKLEKTRRASKKSKWRPSQGDELTDHQRQFLDGRLKSPWTSKPSSNNDADSARSPSGSTAKNFFVHLPLVDTTQRVGHQKLKAAKARLHTTAALLDPRLKTLLLTATHDGAGNTTCVSGLAQALGRFTDNKVLVVDGNRRGNSLSLQFGMEHDPGLFNLLYDRSDLDVSAYVQTANGAGFDLLSSGYDFPTNRPFLRGRIKQFLQTLNDEYRYVIYDAPPIYTSPELYAMASLFDGVALVVQAEKSRWESSQAAVSQLRQSGAKMLGVIMNRRKYYIPEWLYGNL